MQYLLHVPRTKADKLVLVYNQTEELEIPVNQKTVMLDVTSPDILIYPTAKDGFRNPPIKVTVPDFKEAKAKVAEAKVAEAKVETKIKASTEAKASTDYSKYFGKNQ